MNDHADTIRRIEELREEAERRGRRLMSDGHYSFTTARWEDVLWILAERQQAIDRLKECNDLRAVQRASHERLQRDLQQAIDERDALKAHFGADPTNARIREAHSAIPAEWLGSDDAVHNAYKQGHDERCYICTLLVRCEQAIDALREIAKIEDSFQAQSRYTGTVATAHHDCPSLARAALVSLGETE